MTTRRWIVRSIIAGAFGSVVHFLFMYLKSATGLLPEFQPYHRFQIALSDWLGTNVPHIVPWVLSFLNGMTILSLLFGRVHRLLPGRNGLTKGTTFGLIGWFFMDLVFFPLIGLGPFASKVGLGAGPAFLSLGMLLEPISKSPEEDNEASELDEAEEVLGVILPPDENTALPLYPGEEALDEPAPHVTA